MSRRCSKVPSSTWHSCLLIFSFLIFKDGLHKRVQGQVAQGVVSDSRLFLGGGRRLQRF
jgi:hypothetical protein